MNLDLVSRLVPRTLDPTAGIAPARLDPVAAWDPAAVPIPDPVELATRVMGAVHLPTFIALIAVGVVLGMLGSPHARQSRGNTVHGMGVLFGTTTILGLIVVWVIELTLGPPIRWPYKKIVHIVLVILTSIAQPFFVAPAIQLFRYLRRPASGSFLAWCLGVIVMYGVAGYAIWNLVRQIDPGVG